MDYCHGSYCRHCRHSLPSILFLILHSFGRTNFTKPLPRTWSYFCPHSVIIWTYLTKFLPLVVVFGLPARMPKAFSFRNSPQSKGELSSGDLSSFLAPPPPPPPPPRPPGASSLPASPMTPIQSRQAASASFLCTMPIDATPPTPPTSYLSCVGCSFCFTFTFWVLKRIIISDT